MTGEEYIPPGQKLDLTCPECGEVHRVRYDTYDNSQIGKTDRYWCNTIIDLDGSGAVIQTIHGKLCLRRQIDLLRQDAARYRFIRDKLAKYLTNRAVDPIEAVRKFWFVEDIEGSTFDAAVDAAMQQQEGGGT